MKIIYKGKYDGNVDSLPCREHEPGAVKFKEPEDTKKLSIIANGIALLIVVLMEVITYLLIGRFAYNLIGILLSLIALIPHEYLHAICFKEEAYIYTNLNQGMLFCIGPERMSKARFIVLSLLPAIVLGCIPYIIGLVIGNDILITFGVMGIVSAAGDYLNVFNAATQMPKGAKTYLHKFNSYWYIPEEDKK